MSTRDAALQRALVQRAPPGSAAAAPQAAGTSWSVFEGWLLATAGGAYGEVAFGIWLRMHSLRHPA